MELVTYVLLLVIALLIVGAYFYTKRLRTENADLRFSLDFATEWAAANDAEAKVFALQMAPLLEQTDWMTGRWGGQFNTLVAMENSRNEKVRNARRAFNEIPLVQRATMEMFTPGGAFREALAKRANQNAARLSMYGGHDEPQQLNPHDDEQQAGLYDRLKGN
jgi:hypothetical protein